MSVALAFDLEYDGDTLLCAATAWTNGPLVVPQLWVSQDAKGFCALASTTVSALIEHLWIAHCSGVQLVTWGGTGSDWPALLKQAKDDATRDKIRTMALASVDIPLISAASNGMMMGLVVTARGMGLGDRPSCESELVPHFWNSNDPVKQNEVVQHVQWDAYMCAALYSRLHFLAQLERPQLTWFTQRSGQRSVRLPRVRAGELYGLPTVKEVLTWEEPNTAFPIPAHLHPRKLTAWLEGTA